MREMREFERPQHDLPIKWVTKGNVPEIMVTDDMITVTAPEGAKAIWAETYVGAAPADPFLSLGVPL